MSPRGYLALLIAGRYEVFRQARHKGDAVKVRTAGRNLRALVDIWALVQGE